MMRAATEIPDGTKYCFLLFVPPTCDTQSPSYLFVRIPFYTTCLGWGGGGDSNLEAGAKMLT